MAHAGPGSSTASRATMVVTVSHAQRVEPAEILYLRVTLPGNSEDELSMTCYEIDEGGWVHRQFQLRGDRTAFAPEDILMCQPVNLSAMLSHPCTEQMAAADFELLWGEIAGERSFAARLPDHRMAWEGEVEFGGQSLRLRWLPSGTPAGGWTEVPGFVDLFAEGGVRAARLACAALFVERPIQWCALAGETRTSTSIRAAA
jgi:hypothetical protein